MDYEAIFDASYERVKNPQDSRTQFFHAFYERFLNADPRIPHYFRDTDMAKQQQMLEKSFYRLLVFYATNNADEYLEHIAIRHSKLALKIEPDLYDVWLDCLTETVSEYDPEYNNEVELAWRLVLATGITYMKYKYDH